MPHDDDLLAQLRRPQVAPEAGYDEDGPAWALAPEASGAEQRYDGWPRVLQWQIDPHDPDRESHETSVTLGDWEYAVWWQRHPAALLYASLQAVREDLSDAPARQHPVGRSVVVNLVYDEWREAVIAIYGTARDFRPFVAAFRIAAGLQPRTEERTS